jgi:hypothetical protein
MTPNTDGMYQKSPQIRYVFILLGRGGTTIGVSNRKLSRCLPSPSRMPTYSLLTNSALTDRQVWRGSSCPSKFSCAELARSNAATNLDALAAFKTLASE